MTMALNFIVFSIPRFQVRMANKRNLKKAWVNEWVNMNELKEHKQSPTPSSQYK